MIYKIKNLGILYWLFNIEREPSKPKIRVSRRALLRGAAYAALAATSIGLAILAGEAISYKPDTASTPTTEPRPLSSATPQSTPGFP